MIPSILPTYSRKPLRFVKGEGAWLWDDQGRRFLDFGSGIAVNALGHSHPDLVKALTEQAHQLWHVSNLYEIPNQTALADLLVEHSFADTVFFTNSGTEAAELAIKMARRHFAAKGAPRAEILTLEGAFHGRSGAAIAASGAEKMVEGFAPLAPGFRSIAWEDRANLPNEIGPETCAVMVEPIQGEGGIRPLGDALLQALRAACDAQGALLIFDEVQCGMGRTGKLFAHEWAGVVPDILMSAKGIGGGFPLGAVLATEEAAAAMTKGTHGSTYGGNPLACAVGLATVKHLTDEDFLAEVRRKSALLRQRLEGLQAAHPDVIDEIRGEGLLLGLRLKTDIAAFVAAAEAEALLTVPASDQTVRLLPPLVVSDEEINTAVQCLDHAAHSVTATRLADAPQ